MSKNTESNHALWEKAKSAAPLELVSIISLLGFRGWSPKIPAEKEWFEELRNLCAPCKEISIAGHSEDLLKDKSSIEVIQVISPLVSAGNFSIHFHKDEYLLTHCPASSGLVEFWTIPSCERKSQLKLYSRRSAFHLSKDHKVLVSYTDRNTIAVDSFPQMERITEWEHPDVKNGNSYRIETLTDDDEIVATDSTGMIYFLRTVIDTELESGSSDFFAAGKSSTPGLRRFEKILPRRQVLLAAAKSGRYLLIPSFDLTKAIVWSFPECQKIATIDGEGTSEITFLSAAFSRDGRFLIATGVNELQVRELPYATISFSVKLGLGNDLPIFTVSSDSNLLAILPRSNPAQIMLYSLRSGEHLDTLRLPDFFARSPVRELKFTPDNEHLYWLVLRMFI
jgi:WD40 repeat protein